MASSDDAPAEVEDHPLCSVLACNAEEAKEYVERLRAELELRDEEVTRGIVDASAELLLFQRALVCATKRALGESTKDVLWDEPPSDDDTVDMLELGKRLESSSEDASLKTSYADCVKRFKSIEKSVRTSSVGSSGDRPRLPPRKGQATGSNNFIPSKAVCNMLQVPLSRRLQTAVVLMSTFFTGLPLFLFAFFVLHLMAWTAPLMWLYDAYMIYDIFTMTIPPKQRSGFRSATYWKVGSQYFPVRLRVEDAACLPAVKDGQPQHYLFVYHPHGLHSFGAFFNFATNSTGFDQIFPHLKMFVQTLPIQFKLPLWRELVKASAMGDASKGCLNRVLTGPPGNSALLVVGGAEESLGAVPGTFDLVLKKRKGFVKIAMQNGATLVPCFSFGENDVYQNFSNRPSVRKWMKWLKSKLGFAVPLFQGRGIFNYTWGLLPHRRAITTVVGKPIPVEKWTGDSSPQNPEFRKRVDEIHAQYM
eukprot:gene17500-26926_t